MLQSIRATMDPVAGGAAGVVLWDFDGTLVHRPGMWRASLITALDRIDPSHGVTDALIRPGLRNGFPWHAPNAEHVDIRSAADWWARMSPVLVGAYERAGVARPNALAAAELVREVYTEPAFWRVFDDTRPALELLRERGWRHVVLSNHVPELPELVAALGLDDLVDDVITSAATGYEKPHPAMFRLALERIPDTARTVMVGDNPVADVAGAEAAGIPAILVRDEQAHDLAWAARRILDA